MKEKKLEASEFFTEGNIEKTNVDIKRSANVFLMVATVIASCVFAGLMPYLLIRQVGTFAGHSAFMQMTSVSIMLVSVLLGYTSAVNHESNLRKSISTSLMLVGAAFGIGGSYFVVGGVLTKAITVNDPVYYLVGLQICLLGVVCYNVTFIIAALVREIRKDRVNTNGKGHVRLAVTGIIFLVAVSTMLLPSAVRGIGAPYLSFYISTFALLLAALYLTGWRYIHLLTVSIMILATFQSNIRLAHALYPVPSVESNIGIKTNVTVWGGGVELVSNGSLVKSPVAESYVQKFNEIVSEIISDRYTGGGVLFAGASTFSDIYMLNEPVTYVDRDEAMLRVARVSLKSHNEFDTWSDSDPRLFLSQNNRRWSLIYINPQSSLGAVNSPYTTYEYFKVIESRLARHGSVAMIYPANISMNADTTIDLDKTIRSVFDQCTVTPSTYSGYGHLLYVCIKNDGYIANILQDQDLFDDKENIETAFMMTRSIGYN